MPPSTASPHPIHQRARHRSFHIYTSVTTALLVLAVWWLARITLCWGPYSWVGMALCHSQWLTFLGLVVAATVLVLLVRDLAAPHLDTMKGKRLARTRAAWHGYTHLERPASVHVTMSTLLLIAVLLAFTWLVLLSPVRF